MGVYGIAVCNVSKDVSLLTLVKLAGPEKKIKKVFFKWKIKYTEQVIIVTM